MKGLKDWGNWLIMFPIILSALTSVMIILKIAGLDIDLITVFMPFVFAVAYIVVGWYGLCAAFRLIEWVKAR